MHEFAYASSPFSSAKRKRTPNSAGADLATSNIVTTKSTDLKKRIEQVFIGDIFRCWIQRLLLNSHQKCMYSVIHSVLCLGGTCQGHPWVSKNLGKRSHQRTRPKLRISTILRHQRKVTGIRLEDARGETTIEIFERIWTMLEESSVQPSQFKCRIVFMSMYNDIANWKTTIRSRAVNDGTVGGCAVMCFCVKVEPRSLCRKTKNKRHQNYEGGKKRHNPLSFKTGSFSRPCAMILSIGKI